MIVVRLFTGQQDVEATKSLQGYGALPTIFCQAECIAVVGLYPVFRVDFAKLVMKIAK